MHALRPLALISTIALFATALALPAGAQAPDPNCARAGSDDKCEEWVVTYDDNEAAATAAESPADVAVAPDGRSVYTALQTRVGAGFDGKSRWAVVAYDAEGAQRWVAKWGDPATHSFPTSIAVSPDGNLVYVSGSWRVDQVAADGHLTTIAFDAHDGTIVWQSNYDGPAGGTDNARDIVVAPDGRSLYIAGISAGRDNGDLDYAAISYDARTGEEEWVTRWDGVGQNHSDSPFALDLNTRGNMLYLTGWSFGEGEFNNDYGTIAVHTKGINEGNIAWTARYDGVGVHAPDLASALVVTPDDSKVFVTGMSDDVDGGPPFPVNYGYATVAYDALTGEQLWEARKQWSGTTFNAPNAMAVDPSGSRVVVTGQANQRQLDFGTVTYDTETGAEVWSDRYGFQDYDLELGRDIAMDPRGDIAYVTGVSAKSPPGIPGCCVLYAPNGDQLTIAYDVNSGQKEWLARFNPTTTDFVSVDAIAIAPDATMVYTASSLDDQNWDNDGDDNDAGLLAYAIGPGIALPAPSTTSITFADAGDTRGQYSDDTTIAARLTNSYGDPVEDATLTFTFQGATESATTDPDGIARITETLTETPGDHPLHVTYPGEAGVYAPSSAQGSYVIEKEDSRVTLDVRREERSLRATLSDQDSAAPIAERDITFYAKKKAIGTARTDGSGIATLEIPREHRRGRTLFRAVFDGDTFYRPASAGD